MMKIRHGTQLVPHGETVDVWIVLAVNVALRTYQNHHIFSKIKKNMQNAVILHIFFKNICFLCDCRYSTPTRFPNDCVSVFDSKACEYIVHKKNNPSELCPIFAAKGK